MKKFEKGAACIMRRDHFENYEHDPNLTDKFISTKQDIEILLKEANGNIEYLKTRLGITDKNYPKNLDGIYVIHFTPQQVKNASIPSGNESGANKFWIPGGNTASENAIGIPEIVIDCTHLPRGSFNSKYNNIKTLKEFYNGGIENENN